MLRLSVLPAPRPPDPRPNPLDDFALHTGFRLQSVAAGREGRTTIALAPMTSRTRRSLPEFDATLFDERSAVVSILPRRNAHEGLTGRLPVLSLDGRAAKATSLIGISGEPASASAFWNHGRKPLPPSARPPILPAWTSDVMG